MANNLETLKKLLETGLGMAFWTEESIRDFMSELKLPSEVKKFIIHQAKKRKSELANILSVEIKDFLEKMNVHEELQKALAGLTLDVKATIQIKQIGKGVKVRKVKVKNQKA